MPDKTASLPIAKPGMGSLELTEEFIRLRAYQYYEERGCEDGHDLEDWLRAEAEIFGKKNIATATQQEMTEQRNQAAAA